MKAKVLTSSFTFDFSVLPNERCMNSFVEISYRTRSCKYYVVVPTSWLCSWFAVPAYGFTPDDFFAVFMKTDQSHIDLVYDFIKTHNLFK